MGLIIGFIAGAFTALACGIIWGQIVKHFSVEIGFAAIGVGAAAGLAVRMASRAAGFPQQVIGVICAVLGIFLGKVYAFKYSAEAYFDEILGETVTLSIFSVELYEMFIEFYAEAEAQEYIYDLLWIALAIMAAWRIAGFGGDTDGAMVMPEPAPTNEPTPPADPNRPPQA
ncbi:MAG: hypothetical protein ACFB20_03525 [Opitutales bacterium]